MRLIAFKEHLRKLAEGMAALKLCPKMRMLQATDEAKPRTLTVVRMRCKQWTCPVCSVLNLSKWRAHLGKTLSKRFIGVKWCFVTITCPAWLHGDPVATVTRLQGVWKRFYDKIRRYVGRKISYVYMYEAHANGDYHIHALMSLGDVYEKNALAYVWIEPRRHHPLQEWLENCLTAIGGGWVCDIRPVYSANVGHEAGAATAYAMSYMAKSKSWETFKKHARRIGVSTDIGSPPKPAKSPLHWQVRREISLGALAAYDVVEDISIGREIGLGDFENGFYPPASIEDYQ